MNRYDLSVMIRGDVSSEVQDCQILRPIFSVVYSIH